MTIQRKNKKETWGKDDKMTMPTIEWISDTTVQVGSFVLWHNGLKLEETTHEQLEILLCLECGAIHREYCTWKEEQFKDILEGIK